MLKELQTTKDVESQKSRLPWGIVHQVSISKMENSNSTMTKRLLSIINSYSVHQQGLEI